MKDVLLQRAIKLNRNHRQKKWWQRLVRTMAMVVVFCTTYALILPAITMEQQPSCGMEAHIHGEDCYSVQVVSHWGCSPEEGTVLIHSHDALCYDGQGQLICPLAERMAHTHGDSCYTLSQEPVCGYTHEHGTDCIMVETVLICGQEEVPAHEHTQACTTERVLVCTQPESQGHSHDETCGSLEKKQICQEPEGENHTHGESCYETVQLPCQIPESQGHVHGEGCYEIREVPCTQETQPVHLHEAACYGEKASFCAQPTTAEHVHTDACYGSVLTCGQTELALHTHDDACLDGEGNLICGKKQVVSHTHSQDCLPQEQTVEQLVCTMEEHTHDESCYPVGEEAEAGYLCGGGTHTHVDSCYDENGSLICSIPEHSHDETCLVEGYDPNADLETREDWERTLESVNLTGVWAEDLLEVAKTQLGYAESARNVRMEGDALRGFTRYGAKYEQPYAPWNAMFVAFCLEYAEITEEYIPHETDTVRWVHALKDAGQYADGEAYTPAAGDLVFVDRNRDGEADYMGIFVETTEEGALRILAGDTEENRVASEIIDSGVVGYGILPQNPLTPEQWRSANEMAAKLAALPEAEEVRAAFRTLNDAGDKAGYEALRQELVSRMDALLAVYETFNDLQKERAGGLNRLNALKELCGGLTWRQHPALTDDSAVVTGLTNTGVEILAGGQRPEGLGLSADTLACNGDTVTFRFAVETQSYYTDIHYGEARVKVELVLPFTQEEAVFDPAAMTWLENAAGTMEVRSVNGVDTACQILTGYKHLTAPEESGVVVPGSFAETAVVTLKNMSHGAKLTVFVSAAMEHGAWEGLCQTHQVAEKLTIAAESVKIYAPLSAEEQQAKFEEYQATLHMLAPNGERVNQEVLDKLLETIVEDFRTGGLNEEQYSLLSIRILELSGVELLSIAEPATGNGWPLMDFGDPNFVPQEEILYSSARMEYTPMTTAMPAALAASLELDSNSQIPEDGWGGENSSDDGVWVSKTIAGTEQENVFDITLQIITTEKVEEVYKEPDMAVVIVMDISQTMTSAFGDTNRYNAAMASAEQFLEEFANNTNGISQVGYVAFNTHGHEVFPMQQCTKTNWQTMANTMRVETGNIMKEAAEDAEDGEYKNSNERFTNIEAGLTMAQDMLKDVNNQHKYVILLSDGFPTTYLTASTTDGYVGYDPNTGSGTNGRDGVFYDGVMGVHCDYGTSYSDTAAIKARQKAVSMKNSGIKIFSIGVDVAGQTIKKYHDQRASLGVFSVVERRENENYYNVHGYEIGTSHLEITKENPTDAETAKMAQDFKNWLGGTAPSGGIGSGEGYYFDSTNQTGLKEAYAKIFEKIKDLNKEAAALEWVASDPMPDMEVQELKSVEFIGFWDHYGQVEPVLMESLTRDDPDAELFGCPMDNTATFDRATSTIKWKLQESGYQWIGFGDNKNYQYLLRYRVRLQNENNGFIEGKIYDTNDTTTLEYRIVEEKNGVPQISELKDIEFPIPKVFGYLAELNFRKVNPTGGALPGAKFQLVHDTANCGTCRGDGVGYVDLPAYEAVSGDDGMVTFTNIPSGHHYILQETQAPEGYIVTRNKYYVEVAYDTLTVTVKDADGNPLEWTESITNGAYYNLPHTGSVGTTSHYTFGGLLIVAAALMYVTKFGRKQRKGGA